MYTEEQVSQHLWHLKLVEGRSLRQIAGDYGVNHAIIQRGLKGDFPKSLRLRQKFDLPLPANVVAVAGYVPDGTMVLAAQQCACGQFFISNHPARKKCFICSPYRRRVRQNVAP